MRSPTRHRWPVQVPQRSGRIAQAYAGRNAYVGCTDHEAYGFRCTWCGKVILEQALGFVERVSLSHVKGIGRRRLFIDQYLQIVN